MKLAATKENQLAAAWARTDRGKAELKHYALNTTHYTLHNTHYTLHSTHYTLHTTHYTLHTTRYTPHATRYTLHATRYTLHATRYTLHYIISVQLNCPVGRPSKLHLQTNCCSACYPKCVPPPRFVPCQCNMRGPLSKLERTPPQRKHNATGKSPVGDISVQACCDSPGKLETPGLAAPALCCQHEADTCVRKINARSENTRYDSQPPFPPRSMLTK